MRNKDFISLHDFTTRELMDIIKLAMEIKRNPGAYKDACKGKVLALIFEKPSLRTKAAFEIGIFQMGGASVYFGPSDFTLGKREAVQDVAKNMERLVDMVAIRTFAHANVTTFAQNSSKPVINALTDLLHPCQALGDYMTILEQKKTLKGLKLAFVGDGFNMAHSLIYGASKFGVDISVATPRSYQPKNEVVKNAYQDAVANGSNIELTDDPVSAVNNADIVYTDVWASMGQETEALKRKAIFQPYQVSTRLMAFAKKEAIFMHCLPAHRGEEVAADVMDSARSVVFEQAENRLHIQKAIIFTLLGQSGKPVSGDKQEKKGKK
ncbi:MAG: ornithine carbamoyltransferase [Candidatus Omnitrophota bacterium]